MVDLIIVCEDSFGMDVRTIAEGMDEYRESQGWERLFRIKGYICPEGMVLKQNRDALPILGTIAGWQPGENEWFAMGIVDPHRKEEAVALLKSKGAKFATLWSSWVLTPLTMQFGEGCIIAAQSIKANAKIAPFVTLYQSMVANAVVEEYCSVMAFSNITNATLGKRTYVGDNALVLEKLTIGQDSYICPNSVVVKNVKPGTKVSGNPARKIKI